MDSAALYVHIPFCLKKCGYCDFFSVERSGGIEDLYLDCLVNEARFYAEKYSIGSWRTIYIGGGTPSLLSAQQILRLVPALKGACLFPENSPLEITMEMNPESVSAEKLSAAWEGGVTRLSLGIQSLSREALCAAGRHCSASVAAGALELAGSAWKGDLSADVIAGLPGCGAEDFIFTLEKCLLHNASHVSLYTLTLEDGTPLAEAVESGAVPFDFDEADSQWILGRDFLLSRGFVQYEVSNFCREGKKSIHNSSYWEQRDYAGVGCGACGTFYGKKSFRWTNTEDIAAYENFWGKGSPCESGIPRRTEILGLKTREFEFLMTGLRTSCGVNSLVYRSNFSDLEPWNGNLESRLCPALKYGIESRKKSDGSVNFFLGRDSLLFLNKVLLCL
ncbi:coproporphyrinogen-III oxidase family protein [Treponema sp.]|uniref:coproporphyrinogen-III oxidase family protein n=1 Tax=Treponema sp. TaxID=166 RepID=UPI003F0CE442